MRRSLKILFSLSLMAAPAAPALAQVNVVHQADQVRYRSLTVIDFTEVPVEGTISKPSLSFQLIPQKTHFVSLVSLRVNFNDELRRSSDNL
jgi:hypothetical protein